MVVNEHVGKIMTFVPFSEALNLLNSILKRVELLVLMSIDGCSVTFLVAPFGRQSHGGWNGTNCVTASRPLHWRATEATRGATNVLIAISNSSPWQNCSSMIEKSILVSKTTNVEFVEQK